MTLDTSIPVSGITYNGVDMELVSGVSEISTADEMNALLVEANIGKTYKFVGTTDDTYTNGDIYVVEEKTSVTITLYDNTGSNWANGSAITRIIHNGTTYGSPTSFEAEIGDIIELIVGEGATYGGIIVINGTTVAEGNPAIYTYTVVSDATFDVAGYQAEGWVEITEEG